MNPEERQKVIDGIACYGREQKVLLRLLRFKGGAFNERQFDKWFRRRRRGRSGLSFFSAVGPHSYILGLGRNGFTNWARWLHLLQLMACADLVGVCSARDLVIYSLPVDSASAAS